MPDLASAAYWEALMEGLHAMIEALPTTSYQDATSNAWTRARRIDGGAAGTAHLEHWIKLTEVPRVHPSVFYISGELTFNHRYRADGHQLSQSRLIAATMHLLAALRSWRGPGAERAEPRSSSTVALSSEWLQTTVPFLLHIPLPRG